MSEQPHTPTTAEVRLKYESASLGQSASAEFDRWLNEVKAQAWDEGWSDRAGYDATPDADEPESCNPYRKEN